MREDHSPETVSWVQQWREGRLFPFLLSASLAAIFLGVGIGLGSPA
jgi:hypothetical protein